MGSQSRTYKVLRCRAGCRFRRSLGKILWNAPHIMQWACSFLGVIFHAKKQLQTCCRPCFLRRCSPSSLSLFTLFCLCADSPLLLHLHVESTLLTQGHHMSSLSNK